MVSVAGDRQVLVYDVERLERMNNGINLGELNGRVSRVSLGAIETDSMLGDGP